VLRSLPETPLVALGNNAIYQATLDDLQAIPCISSFWREGPEGFKSVQRTLHYGLQRDETVFNVQPAITEKDLEVLVNAHTELRERATEDAQKAARRFFE